MLSIPMGGANVVLGVQCLQSPGMVDFNFQELFLKKNFKRKRSQITRYHREAEKYNKI